MFSATRIKKCTSLKELQERYKRLIIKKVTVKIDLKFIATYFNGCIIVVINSNVPKEEYINDLKQAIINAAIKKETSIRK
ncbi:hypothetical protein ABG79_02366 [Caloramator mitchellensis]|uniref:Uncharacterized protein n=1 Tax=Caloramator mitchellensis TaxID=908809 RepID=A0A0R3JY60_CALMK|nr:hypothetical protein [Caloramator mitchellensis]KRQ85852.1 hypothetical protein ABG79_02366 [Caloramator mitchellensis]